MYLERFFEILSKMQSCNIGNCIKDIKLNQVLFFLQDTSRSINYRNRAFSPLADSLQIELKARGFLCQTVALPWSKIIQNKAYGNPVSISSDRIFELALKKIKLNNFFEYIYGFRNPYHKIIVTTKPRFIISIGCPEDLCREARLAGVPHAELLHGMGYVPIPWGWEKKQINYLPQIILTLDTMSYNTFSPLRSKKIKTFLIPHPFYKNVKYIKNKKAKEKTFLFSLSWGYSGDHGDEIIFKDVVKNGLFPDQLIKLIKSEKNIKWKFRLHPVQKALPKYKNLIIKLKNILKPFKNCEWKKASEDSFPKVIKNCSGHLTMNSMSCYDAAYFGVTSLAFCPTLRFGLYQNMFSDLESKGYVKKIQFSKKYVKKWLFEAKVLNPYRPLQKKTLKDYKQFLSLIRRD